MECNDKNCPVHGNVKVRGNILEAKVVSTKMKNSIVVERRGIKKNRKYERYERTKSRITVHKPSCMEVQVGDKVQIGETKKISKTKNFVVLKIIGEKQ